MPALIVSLITALANTLLSVLTGSGVASSSISNLIETLISSGAALFTSLSSGGTPSTTLQSILTALQADLEALQKDTSVDPTVIAQVTELTKMMQAAITAFEQAEVTEDTSTLTPLPPIE
jgi:hypothetical protein